MSLSFVNFVVDKCYLAIARFQAIANYDRKNNKTVACVPIKNEKMDHEAEIICSNDNVIEVVRANDYHPVTVHNVIKVGPDDDATEEPATKRIKSEPQYVPLPYEQFASSGDETILDIMSQLKSSDPSHWYKVAVEIFVGQIITTTNSNQSYKVVGIDEAVNGNTKTRYDGVVITFAQYYKDRYKINIKYPQEPFLHVNPTAYGQEKLSIYVAPELCVLDMKPSAAFYIDVASGHDTDRKSLRVEGTSSEIVQAVKPCTSSLISNFELSSEDELNNEDVIPVAQPSPQSVFSRLGDRVSVPRHPRLRARLEPQFVMPEHLKGAESVIDVMDKIRKRHRRNWCTRCNDKLAGQSVMTCYDNQVYKILKIRGDRSSNSTIHSDGRDVSYVTFFKENYGITIKFPGQNLVMACPSAYPKESQLLVPELCYIITIAKQEENSFRETIDNSSSSQTSAEVVADSDNVSIISTSPSTSSGYASSSSGHASASNLNTSEMVWKTTPPPGEVSSGTKIYGPNYILLGHIECRYKQIHFLEQRFNILLDQIESRQCDVSIWIKSSHIEWMGLPGPYPFLSFAVKHSSRSEMVATQKLFVFLSESFGTEKVRDLTFTRIWIQVHDTTIQPNTLVDQKKDPMSAAQLLRQNIIQVRIKRRNQRLQRSKIVQEFIDNKIIRF